MKNALLARIFLFTLSLICQWVVISQVITRTVDNIGLALWFLSLTLLYFAFPSVSINKTNPKKKYLSKTDIRVYVLAFLIIAIALTIRIILMTNTYAFHNDEYISAFFSYSIGDLSKLDWFGIYPVPHDWIWQFPLFYFFFQKVFFNIFGVDTLIMRLSIVPYILTVFISLFLIVKRLYSKEAAYLAIAILAIFSPDLYLSRWALHFISSTAFFLVATYFFILSVNDVKKHYFALLGFFLGLCYFVYYSSYIAIPLLSFYLLTLILVKKIRRTLGKGFILTIGILIYTISPLVVYAAKVENFFIDRTEQVKLINGSWSPYKNIETPMSALEVFKKQWDLSVSSLYTDGIGGHGGYTFGHLALFDQVTLSFLLVGFCYFIYRVIRFKDIASLFILVTIFATFLTGMVLTFPPPAFHRISLIFPFIVLVIGVTIANFYAGIKRKHKKTAFFFLLTFVLIVISNLFHFGKIMVKDRPDDPDYPKIQQYLEKHNEKKLYVAAFDSYGMGGILFIRSGGKIQAITHSLDEILPMISKDKTSYLAILYPNEEAIQKLKEVFPQAALVGNYQTHELFKLN